LKSQIHEIFVQSHDRYNAISARYAIVLLDVVICTTNVSLKSNLEVECVCLYYAAILKIRQVRRKYSAYMHILVWVIFVLR
jgi:hypothetical protein